MENVAKDIKTNTAQFIAIKYSDDHKLYKDENSKAVAQSLQNIWFINFYQDNHQY